MRMQLLTAAAAAALLATPALAQDMTPPPEPTNPPVTSPVDAPTADAVAPTPSQDVTQPEATTPAPETTDTTAATQTADATQGEDIVDVLRAQGQFTTLVSALDAAGLTATLENNSAITILAPTDAAFQALPAGELDRLMAEENRDELRQVLLYHVINADVRREQIADRRGAVQTGSGAQILLDGGNGTLLADAATITNADLRGSNGAVMVIDQVLNPETSLAGQGDAEAPATEAEDATTPEAPAEPEATSGEQPMAPATETDPADAGEPVEPASPQA